MMKFIIRFCLGLLLVPQHGFAAIAATTAWEIRSTATASNANGGGFNASNASPGTDRSQQDAAQFSGTDLASTNGTTNPCVVTSATHNFVSSDNGNIIYISAGTSWTASRYEVVSTSGNAATLDRACGSAATLSGGTWKLGGALSMQASNDGTALSHIAPGNTLWVKAGTYTQGSNYWQSMTNCTAAAPCYLIGYSSTRGDNPTGSSRPQINYTSASMIMGAYFTVMNLSVYSTNTNSTWCTMNAGQNNISVINTKIINASGTAIPALNIGTNTQVIGVELASYGGYGIQVSATTGLSIHDSYFHDSLYGIYQSYNGAPVTITATNNIFENLTGAGVYLTTSALGNIAIIHNTFYGGESVKTGIGINMVGSNPRSAVLNNIFYGLTTGVTSSAAFGNTLNFNNFYNCTTDVSGVTKGTNTFAVNPTFKSVGQYTGTTATTSGAVLTDSGANFANVVAGRDYLLITGGTGITPPVVAGITSKTSTTLTTDVTLGTHGTADVTYEVIYGHDFTPTATSLLAAAGWSTGNVNVTNYLPIGAIVPQYTDPGVAKVKSLWTYVFGGTTMTGTLTGGFPKRPR